MEVTEFLHPTPTVEDGDDSKEKKSPTFDNLFDSETDKKYFTPLGLSKLLEKTKVDVQKIHTFVVDESNLNRPVYVSSVIEPDLLVIHFSNILSPSDPGWKRLLNDLTVQWKSSSGFDMLVNFPGEGVYVAAAVAVASDHEDAQCIEESKLTKATQDLLEYQNEDPPYFCESGIAEKQVEAPSPEGQMSSVDALGLQLAASSLDNHSSKVRVSSKSVVYYRGFITKLKPGKDINSAKYDVFLYDKGFHKEFTLDQIIPLHRRYRENVPPQYQLLKFPGLKPLKVIQRCLELYTRRTASFNVICEDWPAPTVRLVKELLSSKILKLEVLGVHGMYVYANLIFTEIVNNEEVQLDYVKYLEDKRLAEEHSPSYLDEMLKDAEDEELGDWMWLARTCS